MCGIFGFFDRQQPLTEQQVAQMGQAIVHRGPDDAGIFYAEGVGLGNQRLSIVDVMDGHQPFVSDDGQVVVVFNGEVYNHVELRQQLAAAGYQCRTHCDTEVILGWYLQGGIACLQRFNGMFAIAIYDARQTALYLARDRVGIKPLFWQKTAGGLRFGSEIKALKAVEDSARINAAGLLDFLQFGFVLPTRTLSQGVEQLQPGCWMRVDAAGQVQTQRWWDLSAVVRCEDDADTAIEAVKILVSQSVKDRSQCEVPFGAFLSGGVDSGSVVAMMSAHLDTPLKTFCIGFEDPRYDESGFAAEVAARFATDHHMQRVGPEMMQDWPLALYHCDQPHSDVSFVPTLQLAKLAHQQVKVVLTGDGGDECFAGYDKYAPLLEIWQGLDDSAARVRALQAAISVFDLASLEALVTPELWQQWDIEQGQRYLGGLIDQVADWDLLNQLLYVDMQMLLPGNNLVKPDRMGMAVSLEARTPLLDHRLVEYAFSLPGAYKLRDGQTKWLLKQAMREHLGDALTARRKQMFTVPIGDWMMRELQPQVTALLRSEAFHALGWFRPAAVDKLLSDHLSGRANHTRQLRSIVGTVLSSYPQTSTTQQVTAFEI